MSSRRLFYFLLIFLFLFALGRPAMCQANMDCTGNESWIYAGTSFAGRALAATEMNEHLYVLHRSDPADSLNFQISVWDGFAWRVETSFRLTNLRPERDPVICTGFQAYNGSLYMGGFFDINYNKSLSGFVRWDGSSWSSVADLEGAPEFMYPAVLYVHNGKLIISALLTEGVNVVSRTMQFDGSNWSYLKDTEGNNLSDVSTILNWNGDLYLGVDGVFPYVARWDGTTLTDLGRRQEVGTLEDLFVHNNQLYATGWWYNGGKRAHHLMRWNGTSWTTNVPQPNRDFFKAKAILYEGHTYLVSSPDSTFFRGDHGSFQSIERFDGTAWHIVSNFNGRMHFLTSYNGNLFAGGNFTSSCGTPLANIGLFCDDLSCMPAAVDAPADVLPSLVAYPNPARSILHLEGKLRSGTVMKLRNLLGEEVVRCPHDGNGQMTIDISALPVGTYMLEAETTEGRVIERISVVR